MRLIQVLPTNQLPADMCLQPTHAPPWHALCSHTQTPPERTSLVDNSAGYISIIRPRKDLAQMMPNILTRQLW